MSDPLYPALGDAYRKVVVTQGLTSETTTATAVDAQFNLDAGFGITLVTDVLNNKVTIVNTGNGTGALTTITDNNSLGTFYPIFTRAPDDAITFTAGTVPPNSYVTADVPIGVAEIRITGSINDPTGVSYELRTALTGLVTGETFQGVKVSDAATLNFVSAGPATYSTLDGYWTVPIDTANLNTETLSSITIATGTGNYNQATGTYQMDTMYLDQTTTPLTYNPNTSTLSVSNISGVSFTMSGHVTLEGVTSTGATGTGKFVFDNAPTITGHPTIEGQTLTGVTGTGKLVLDNAPTISGHPTIEGQTLTGVTGTGKLVLDNAPTISGHPTIEGVTSTGATGTGNLVFDSSPTLITPTLGVASATSINKVTITAPTTSSTITISDGKVFTVNNTITLQGTDSTIITLPATTGTVPLDNQQFYIGTTAFNINRSSAAQSLTGITSIDGYASNLAGGNNTTLLGSVHYQSDSNVTTQLAPNTTTTKKFLRQTGDGTNGAVPAWDTVTATDVGLGNVTNESKATMFTSPTFTGHPTVEGVTSTGATGTNKFVFDTAPTIAGGSITGLTTFALRDTSAAFDVTLAAVSSTTLTAGRTLTIDIVNAARTVKLAGNIDLAGNLTTANTFTTSGNFALTLTTTNTTNVTLPTGTVTLYGTGSGTITSSQLATSLSDETGSGSAVFGTNPTITSPTFSNSSSSTDADVTVDASTTEYYAYVQSASTTTRTINISNLTAGRRVTLYLRNTNVGAKSVNIAASTTASGFAAVNLATSNGAVSATSVTLAASTGTAVITVFNANGTIGGGM